MSLPLSHAGSSLLWLLVVSAPEAKAPSTDPPMILAMRTGDTRLEHAPISMGRADRYFELDRASVSGRFRSVERVGGALTELQYQGALTGRFKLDSKGKLAVRAGAFTGNGFTGGWDGIVHLKQLYLEARAVPRLSVQIGGLDIAHGEATEVTSYDFDGYLVGERARYEGANALFDTLALTVAHLGELDSPSVLDRLETISDPNYTQLLWTKRWLGRLRVSAEYTYTADEPTWRQAARLDRVMGVVDVVHFENYQRGGKDPGYGFGLYGQRRFSDAVVLGLGFARIDRSGLNSDRFPRGTRAYATALLPIGRELTLSVFFSQAFGETEPSSLRRRLDLALSYNVLASFSFRRRDLSGS